jgi:tyrosyl-tRNA synthetase
MKNKEEIEAIEKEHNEAPHLRKLQKALAEEVTVRVHSEEALKRALETTEILFGSSFEEFKKLDGEEIEGAFDNDVTYRVSKEIFINGTEPVGLLGADTQIFPSKGEARKTIQGNGVSLNKEKLNLERKISADDLLYGKYLLVQKGKNKHFLIIAN